MARIKQLKDGTKVRTDRSGNILAYVNEDGSELSRADYLKQLSSGPRQGGDYSTQTANTQSSSKPIDNVIVGDMDRTEEERTSISRNNNSINANSDIESQKESINPNVTFNGPSKEEIDAKVNEVKTRQQRSNPARRRTTSSKPVSTVVKTNPTNTAKASKNAERKAVLKGNNTESKSATNTGTSSTKQTTSNTTSSRTFNTTTSARKPVYAVTNKQGQVVSYSSKPGQKKI